MNKHSENYKHPKTRFNGIIQYLSKEKRWTSKGYQYYDPNRELNRIFLGFFVFAGIETNGMMRSKKMISLNPASQIIHNKFEAFKEYVKTLDRI